MLRKQINNTENGFTLIEVMVSISIFAIGILALMTTQLGGISGNSSADRVTMSTAWSADQIEQLMSLNYSDPDLDDGDGDDSGGLNDSTVATADGFVASPDGLYNIFWNVAIGTPSINTKTVRIITQKVGGIGSGTNRAVIFDYIMADISQYQ